MNNRKPEVSVVIPFYSEKQWLIEALDSVLDQTYKNLEIIVVNDGSSEDISEIESKYSGAVIFFYKENGGPSSARNLGIKNSRGKYIAFLDSDDIWGKHKLEKQISQMKENKAVWSQHSYKMFWDGKNKSKIVDTSNLNGNVFLDCFISFKVQTSTVVVLKEILVENEIYFPLDQRYGQDLTFFKKIAEKYPLHYVDGVHSLFRIRGKNAGFRARVQLENRANVWTELQKHPEIIKDLPNGIVKAYKQSATSYNLYKKISNNSNNELLAKLFYMISYIRFKTTKWK